jgi:hypothetical protein
MPNCAETPETQPLPGRSGDGGAWAEEARRVRLLAAELGGAVDAQALLYADVRDLIALRVCLRSHLQSRGRHSRWLPRRHPCCARARALFGIRLPRTPAFE